jgi:hypothetical protein
MFQYLAALATGMFTSVHASPKSIMRRG